MRSKPFVGILIFTFLVIIIWIAADIYHARSQVSIDPKIQALLDPVNPNFDQDTLKKISNATPAANLVVASAAPTPRPTTTPSPITSPSPFPTPPSAFFTPANFATSSAIIF